jgi:hypothetical protein
LAALEKQGMTSAEFEGYLKKALPVYYMLMPAMAGIIACWNSAWHFWLIASP